MNIPRLFLKTPVLAVLLAMSLPVPVFAKGPGKIELSVPYVAQVSDGNWVAPWDEACEEASIAMIDGFYAKRDQIPVDEAKRTMQEIIDWENATFKNYQDTNAEETKRVIKENASFNSTIKRNPRLEDIKAQLAEGRPVIILIDMYAFYQETPLGDSYHVAVLTGYDDEGKEFIVNDPGRERKRYSYDVVMNALHDFNADSKEGDGTPTVLFTSPNGFRFGDFLQKLLAAVRSWF
jgi:hypothetical protein